MVVILRVDSVVGMKRVNNELKTCNSCRQSKPLTEYYETKQTCKSCERKRELKPGQVDNNSVLTGWKR